jgi:hypothetical protein
VRASLGAQVGDRLGRALEADVAQQRLQVRLGSPGVVDHAPLTPMTPVDQAVQAREVGVHALAAHRGACRQVDQDAAGC